jgi:hypothetical protein
VSVYLSGFVFWRASREWLFAITHDTLARFLGGAGVGGSQEAAWRQDEAAEPSEDRFADGASAGRLRHLVFEALHAAVGQILLRK